jgi:hypothetical protein
VAEGAPSIVVIAQVGADVQEVSATFPGGAVDSTSPVDGLAVLAAPAPGLDGEAGYDGERLGVVVTTDTGLVDDDISAYGYDFTGMAECEGPSPTLPEPGEQPADPDAARADAVAAFETFYDASLPVAERAVHLEGGLDLMGPIVEELLASSYADQVRQARGYVDDLVFTAPDEAWIEYHIELGGSPSFSGRFGQMLLVDGTWIITTETYCSGVSLAGVACPAQ